MVNSLENLREADEPASAGHVQRPMFAATEQTGGGDDDARYVLFEQAPLTGDWILQGATTRTLYADWCALKNDQNLPLLDDFDSAAREQYLQYAVVHLIHSKDPYVFDVAFVGEEVSRLLGMSRHRRLLTEDTDSLNSADAYKRLSDAAAYRHPHFAVKTLGWQGRDLTKYEVLILPFGRKDTAGTAATITVMSFSSGFDPKYWLNAGV